MIIVTDYTNVEGVILDSPKLSCKQRELNLPNLHPIENTVVHSLNQ